MSSTSLKHNSQVIVNQALREKLFNVQQEKSAAGREVDKRLLAVTELRSTCPPKIALLVDREKDLLYQKLANSPVISTYQTESIQLSDIVTAIQEAATEKEQMEHLKRRIGDMSRCLELKKRSLEELDSQIQENILPYL
ncbi:unnamed protein product [Enterobius vermicularis]|uniref:Uncharacterized protein n=1 Tax=Enterobius vermicularis TaxID=51028 RepID=A0A0N4VHV5_ENTVE|nr:unnamed protein product [Enterobius vermicularis]